MEDRIATLDRKTGETHVTATVNLDGSGKYDVKTGNGFLDHMISQLSRHGLFDITLRAQGDLETGSHHLTEDIAISLGQTFRKALGEIRGIRRMGHAFVPLDETLARVVVDWSGRGYAVVETALAGQTIDNVLAGDQIKHFLERFGIDGEMNLHAHILYGSDPHHKAEALFKALARALRTAVERDPRATGQIPSTKGTPVD
ncbi:imidazoleglycerol-phosphate dehydratase [Patescibacteria group bacterium]|nr:imidazoleglycerol-phosphate dehydratase [Patescibacteria group bacterium]